MSEATDKLIERIINKYFSTRRESKKEAAVADVFTNMLREALAEYESSQWVSVQERLPERRHQEDGSFSERVMAIESDGAQSIQRYFYSSYSSVGGYWTGESWHVFTHWRPLPEPPVIAKKEKPL